MQTLIKYLFISFVLLGTISATAQRIKKPQNLIRYDYKKLHFGFTLGINNLNFNIKKNANTITNDTLKTLYSKSQKGFNLGIVSNLRLGKYTDLRFVPALIFGERHLYYGFADSLNTDDNRIKKIESTLIDFPIYIKYKSARYNNFRTYVVGGIKYSMDIASKDQIDDEGQEIVKLMENDLMGEIGFGIDFYLEYFKFSPQIKLSHGFLNLLSQDESIYTKSINRLSTNGWMLSFTFE
ncbi:MAG: PorT-like protein [Flavobacteriales bacterium]|nr:PorT-like protein [Flavobacteriales bacterium]|tara:strand:- start:252 stop:965 length:714 start_codon:yes stop_codon:yes gene_type:complete